MRKSLVFMMGLIFLFLTACSSVIVNYDYDTQNNFSKYQTYKWLHNKNIRAKKKWDSINYKRIRKAINSELKSKGFKLKVSGKTDFFVIAYGNVKDNKTGIATWDAGYGAGWNIYRNDVFVNSYKKGTLIIDIVDAKKKQLVWRGSGINIIGKNYSPKEKTEAIKKVVDKILKSFPPSK